MLTVEIVQARGTELGAGRERGAEDLRTWCQARAAGSRPGEQEEKARLALGSFI